jgi:chemotaxis protein histidine kinase CheA
MSRVTAFFLEEADACLAALGRDAVAAGNVAKLHAAARRLRGNAQLARYGAVTELALRLERRLKSVARGQAGWTPAVAAAVVAEVAALEEAIGAVREGRIQREPTRGEGMDQPVDQAGAEVAMEELEYRGEAALVRATQLRGPLEDAIAADEGTGPILDELFDLIRLGME